MDQTYCPYCMKPLDSAGEPCPHCGKDPSDYQSLPHHLPPGTLLQGRYVLGRVLGEGGFGITYIGLDRVLGLKVAIKEYYPAAMAMRDSSVSSVISSRYGSNSDGFAKGMAHFLSEARVMARMDKQTAIVGVRDFFETNGTAYIVMEYVEGITLLDLAKSRGGRVSPDELLPMLEPLIWALDALHEAGLLHRDISPDNIMLENGVARLIDFGCAREGTDGSKTMTVVLKYDYAPLEQYNRKGQGPWTDVYSLAATIYRCICGQAPLRAVERLSGDGLIPPTAMGVPLTPTQEAGLMKALALRVADRTKSMAELHDSLYAPVSRPERGYNTLQGDAGWHGHAQTSAETTLLEGYEPDSSDNGWSQRGFTVVVDHGQVYDGQGHTGHTGTGAHTQGGQPTTYTFMGVTCADNAQLAYELARDWQNARSHLYARNLERHFVAIGDNDLSALLYEITANTDGSKKSQDVGLAKAIWYIGDCEVPLIWRGKDVTLPTLSAAFASESLESLSVYDDLLSTNLLSWYFDQLEGDEYRRATNLMRTIEKVGQSDVLFARYLFLHLFAQGGRSQWAGCTDYESLMGKILASPYAVYQLVQHAEQMDDALAAAAPFAVEMGKTETLTRRQAELAAAAFPADQDIVKPQEVPQLVGQLLDLLDAVGRGSSYVQLFAQSYGPKGAWFWMARNASLYSCNEDQQGEPINRAARNALNQLSVLAGNELTTMAQVNDVGTEAGRLCQVVFKAMDATPMPNYLGYSGGATVSALHVDALPFGSFYGSMVPRGFVGSLLAASPETEATTWDHVELLSQTCQQATLKDDRFSQVCERESAPCAENTGHFQSSIRILAFDAVLMGLALFGFFGGGRHEWLVKQATSAFKRLGPTVSDRVNPETLVTLAIVSVIAYLLMELVISGIETYSAFTAKEPAEKSRTLIGQGRSEISQFGIGTSALAKQLSDPSWQGPMPSIDIVGQVRDIARRTTKFATLRDMPWYPAVWHITALAPSLLAACIIFFIIVRGSYTTAIEFLGRSNTPKMYNVEDAKAMADICCNHPVVQLGLLVSYVWGTMLSLGKRQRNIQSWLLVIIYAALLALAIAAVVGIIVLVAASKAG